MNPDMLESAIKDFRDWHAEWNALENSEFPEPTVDFAAVVAGFAALRHEVNLQTRSARTAIEQSAEALKLLQSNPTSAEEPPQTAAKPFVKALIDVYDQLATASHGVEKRRDMKVVPAADAVKVTGFAKFFGFQKPSVPQSVSPSDELIRSTIDALLTGYRMSMSRIDKLLIQHGLEVIPTTGLSFDPELMEAIEVDDTREQSSGKVKFEIRRGYRWNGQIFRCAQVKVAR